MQEYPLRISIPRAEERPGTLGNYTVFVVEIDDCGQIFHRFRRYGSFANFYSKLKITADFPAKRYMGRTNPSFVEERRAALECFLHEIMAMPTVILGDLFWSFLETPSASSIIPRYLCGGTLAPVAELALNDAMVFRLCNPVVVKMLMTDVRKLSDTATLSKILLSMLSRPGARTLLLEQGAVAALCYAIGEIELGQCEDVPPKLSLDRTVSVLAALDVVIPLIESDPAGTVLGFFQSDGLLLLRQWADSDKEQLHDAAIAMIWSAIWDASVRQALATDVGLSVVGLLLMSPSSRAQYTATMALSVFACFGLLPYDKEARFYDTLKEVLRTVPPTSETIRSLLSNDEFNKLLLRTVNVEVQDFILWIMACFCDTMPNCTERFCLFGPLLHAIDSPAAAQVLLFVPWPYEGEVTLEVLLQRHTVIQTFAGAANEVHRITVAQHLRDQERLLALQQEATRRGITVADKRPPTILFSDEAEEGDLLESSYALQKLDASLRHLRDKRYQLSVTFIETQRALQVMTMHLERTAVTLAQFETQKALEPELAEIQVSEGMLSELRSELNISVAADQALRKTYDDSLAELECADKKRIKTVAQMRRVESEAVMAERRLKQETIHLQSLPSRREQTLKMKQCKETELEKVNEEERKCEDLVCTDIGMVEKEVGETFTIVQALKNVEANFESFRKTLESETVLTAPQQMELEKLCGTLPKEVEWDGSKKSDYRCAMAVLRKSIDYWEKSLATRKNLLEDKRKAETRRLNQLSALTIRKRSLLETLETLKQEVRQLHDESCHKRLEDTTAKCELAIRAREEAQDTAKDAAGAYEEVAKIATERKDASATAREKAQADKLAVSTAAMELTKKCTKLARSFKQLDVLGRKEIEDRKQRKVQEDELQGLLCLSEEALVAEADSRRQLQLDLAELRAHLSCLDSQLNLPVG